MPRIAFIIWIVSAAAAWAQQGRLAADFAKEGQALQDSCNGFSFGKLGSCAEVLFTDHPLHFAVGSLAPQNGFGVGGAFVYHWTPTSWRNSLNVDAVATPNGSWRAGAYGTFVWIRRRTIVSTVGPPPASKPETSQPGMAKSNISVQEQPVFHIYAENTSLNKLTFFGLGPDTRDTARSYYGMRETIAGANVVWPVWKPLNLSLYGEANGRFVDIRGSHGQTSPSIEQLYTPVTAPGLLNQSGYAQFGEGVRIRPELAKGYVRLNYSASFQEFFTSGASSSFQRFTLDLQHQFLLYKTTRSLVPNNHNGPDDSSSDSKEQYEEHKLAPLVLPPPPPGKTRDLEGSFGLRLWINESFVSSGNVVPFYFQPTLGGSDINGNPSLSSYQDYRFRGPNTLLFRANFEHSVYNRWPLGVTAIIDEGKVALTHGDIDFTHLRHSYSAGLTLRAGGFPVIYLLFSWGGREGMHTNARMDTSLLGGSTRPSYY